MAAMTVFMIESVSREDFYIERTDLWTQRSKVQLTNVMWSGTTHWSLWFSETEFWEKQV